MIIELLKEFLGWCTVINIGILLYWFLMIIYAHDFVYKFHTRWFKLSVEKFDAIHYSSMAYFKLTVFIFNLVPYLVLYIMS
jgi:hypothetical protein